METLKHQMSMLDQCVIDIQTIHCDFFLPKNIPQEQIKLLNILEHLKISHVGNDIYLEPITCPLLS